MNKRKSLVIGLASLLILLLAGLGIAQKVNKQMKRRLASHQQLQERQEATPIQEGVMTEQQRQHAKLFKGYGSVTRGKSLRELVAKQGNVEVGRFVEDGILPTSFNQADYLRGSSCKADAVVIAAVKGKASQLTEEGTFTFTDYQVTVEEVLKNNPAASVRAGSDITVTRAGGAVKLNNHTVVATDESEKSLETGGRYLLFLRFIPETGAYRSLSNVVGDDSFQLRGDLIMQVSGKPFPLGAKRATDATAFMNEVRTAAKGSCGSQGMGR